jgi:hypothetical protein
MTTQRTSETKPVRALVTGLISVDFMHQVRKCWRASCQIYVNRLQSPYHRIAALRGGCASQNSLQFSSNSRKLTQCLHRRDNVTAPSGLAFDSDLPALCLLVEWRNADTLQGDRNGARNPTYQQKLRDQRRLEGLHLDRWALLQGPIGLRLGPINMCRHSRRNGAFSDVNTVRSSPADFEFGNIVRQRSNCRRCRCCFR